jgi:AbrB family looped-hinge helix DNA binding protein
MIMKIVKISEKGQIAIPREIQREMNLEKGDELVLTESKNEILIQKKERVKKLIEDDFADMREEAYKNLAKMWDNEEDEIWESYLKK